MDNSRIITHYNYFMDLASKKNILEIAELYKNLDDYEIVTIQNDSISIRNHEYRIHINISGGNPIVAIQKR